MKLKIGGSFVLVAALIAALGLSSGGGGATCAFPSCFPSASNTGVPSGTTLTAYSGPTTITADNTTITGKTINSCIGIATTADNITIRNSRINCNNGWAVQVDDSGTAGSRLTIQDSEVLCTSGTGGSGVVASQTTLTRVEISGCENGCSVGRDMLIQDSFIHNVISEAIHTDAHSDGCQFDGGHLEGASFVTGVLNVTFEHNRIEGVSDEDNSRTTSAIIANPTASATDTNVLIQHNYIKGGNSTIYCPRPGVGSNFRVINNKIDENPNPLLPGVGGETDCNDEAGISGNIAPDGSAYVLD